MNAKIKLVIGIALLAAVIIGAYFAYQTLSQNYSPDLSAATPTAAPAAGTATPQTTIDGNAAPTGDDEQTGESDKGAPAPDFVVTDIDGNELNLSDFFGKPIVLNFWASWCPPCKAELPDFDKLYLEVKDDVSFLMVDLVDGYSETVQDGSEYIAENGYSFPVYYDTAQDAANTYGISSIPTTLFIDESGNIIAGHVGQMNEDLLRQGLSMIYARDGSDEAS